jgi:hypothetical protein
LEANFSEALRMLLLEPACRRPHRGSTPGNEQAVSFSPRVTVSFVY